MARPAAILLANLVATAVMAGVIWYVQLVHYPLMAGWPHDAFGAWEALHRERTGWIVVPVMLMEGATATLLLTRRPEGVPTWLAWAAAAALAGVWASTFLLQVPCHELLARGWDEAVHRRLVDTNWLRTALWTGRLALVVAMAVAAGAWRPEGASSPASPR
jgi:hypothetical protein